MAEGWKHDGATSVFHQMRGRSGRLQYRPVWGQIAAKYSDTTVYRKRISDRSDHLFVSVGGVFAVFANGLSGYGQGFGV